MGDTTQAALTEVWVLCEALRAREVAACGHDAHSAVRTELLAVQKQKAATLQSLFEAEDFSEGTKASLTAEMAMASDGAAQAMARMQAFAAQCDRHPSPWLVLGEAEGSGGDGGDCSPSAVNKSADGGHGGGVSMPPTAISSMVAVTGKVDSETVGASLAGAVRSAQMSRMCALPPEDRSRAVRRAHRDLLAEAIHFTKLRAIRNAAAASLAAAAAAVTAPVAGAAGAPVPSALMVSSESSSAHRRTASSATATASGGDEPSARLTGMGGDVAVATGLSFQHGLGAHDERTSPSIATAVSDAIANVLNALRGGAGAGSRTLISAGGSGDDDEEEQIRTHMQHAVITVARVAGENQNRALEVRWPSNSPAMSMAAMLMGHVHISMSIGHVHMSMRMCV